MTITFVRPDGRTAAPPIGRPRARVVSAEIRALPSLRPGRWPTVLRVRRVAARTAAVRVG